MIAVDTNVLVRFLTGDDPQQFKKALRLFETHQVFIPDTVVLEAEWVLRFAYEFSSTEICEAFNRLFGLPNVHCSDPTLIAQAILWHQHGLDFADAIHLALSQKKDRFFTFDTKFIRKAKGLCGCSVVQP